MGSVKVTDEKLELVLANMAPCTLPQQAYGSGALHWERPGQPVWAWVTWPHRAAERVSAFAIGWNDRVVMVRWDTARGEVQTVVWRNAVTSRKPAPGTAARVSMAT